MKLESDDEMIDEINEMDLELGIYSYPYLLIYLTYILLMIRAS